MESFYILNDAIHYVEKHLKDAITAEDIAGSCNYSVSNLKYLFRKVFQFGMMDYVNRRKITEAAGELISTSKTVCTVAYDFGFGSQEVFTRAFNKIWEETPGVYRKHRHFYQLFPRQEFYYDVCKVFRRRFDLSPLMDELKGREGCIVACFDIISIRFIKTCYGRASGETAALKALQRIEKHMGDGARLYRIAGDKFAVTFGTADYESVYQAVLSVLSLNGRTFLYKEDEIPLSMFAGIQFLPFKGLTEDGLFDQLNEIIAKAHQRLSRSFTGLDGSDHYRIRYEEESGLYQGFAANAFQCSFKGQQGLMVRVPKEQTEFVFSLDEKTPPIRWKTTGSGYEMFFPEGHDWYIKTVFDDAGTVIREHYYIIRNLSACGDHDVSYTLLHLEVVKTSDGRILTLNEGELKEALYEGYISKEEYRFIQTKGKLIRAMIENKRE